MVSSNHKNGYAFDGSYFSPNSFNLLKKIDCPMPQSTTTYASIQ